MDNASRTGQTIDSRELTSTEHGRIDSIIAAACPDLSRARVQRLIAAGAVTLNGEHVRKSGEVAPGDVVVFDVPFVEHGPGNADFDLPVLFEDDLLVVVNKPAGLAVHGAPGDQGPTVAAWFVQRLGKAAGAFDAERPGIVHRLDKDTTGVLLLAKTPPAQAALSGAFEARETKKTYVAICAGVPSRPRAVIDAPIARHPVDRMRMAVTKRGRDARTEYEVLATGYGRSLLAVRPETGRTHQIRVHLAAIGTPVTFDKVYGNAGDGRQQLHAWRLSIPHPSGGWLTATAELPPDMAGAVRLMQAEVTAAPYTTPTPTVRTEECP
ncbi:MAG: RluA family pseudouridine synthase [Chloroflexi bacterium]|nr:RluA family pseudouridine synthase [Chloroflexota bacterium]